MTTAAVGDPTIFRIGQGEDFERVVTFADGNGNPYDLTDYEIVGEIRAWPSGQHLATFDIVNDSAVLRAAGQFSLRIPAWRTMKIERDGVYDVSLVSYTPVTVRTLLRGKVVVIPRVTEGALPMTWNSMGELTWNAAPPTLTWDNA
jgi:hypothetical protein